MKWFDPLSWGNTDRITLEIARIVLCIQIVAVAVELPRKYMKKHWLSVAIFLLPVMTFGWLIVGLFIWALIPHFDFPSALLVSACVTATDPILAAAVVGKGKFAERVPGHLRNLLSAESGCNDGMAFPFIFLSLNLVLYPGNGKEIVKNWFTLTILWECICGCLFGVALGYVMRKAVFFAEKKKLIDHESFLALFVFLAFNSAGIGSLLGVDDLLMSFAAGTAFGWNGEFARKTEELHVSTVIDLLLNLAFFVYFGAIIPWAQFNNAVLGLNCWRLVILAIVIVFLRRLPAVVALKPFTPDIKTWREAFFCGHFGPIGVGAIFAAILARGDLEAHYAHGQSTPFSQLPPLSFPHFQLIASIWPIVCFVVITSIIVHGSSVAVLTLGRRLNRMAITMSYTATNTVDAGPTWMSRLRSMDRSEPLLRQDTRTAASDLKESDSVNLATDAVSEKPLDPDPVPVETSGIKFRPAGGALRRKRKHQKRHRRTRSAGERIRHSLLRHADEGNSHATHSNAGGGGVGAGGGGGGADEIETHDVLLSTDRPRPPAQVLQLGRSNSRYDSSRVESSSGDERLPDSPQQVPTTAFKEGSKFIVEDQDGEIIDTFSVHDEEKRQHHSNILDLLEERAASVVNNENEDAIDSNEDDSDDDDDDDVNSLDEDKSIESDVNPASIHSLESFRRKISQYSEVPPPLDTSPNPHTVPVTDLKDGKKGYFKKNSPQRKVFVYQVGNTIVVENEDGDIVRRYKVQRQVKKAAPKARPNAMDKALSYVGIKLRLLPQPPADQPEQSGSSPSTAAETGKTVILRQDTKVHDNVRDEPVMSQVEQRIADMVDAHPSLSLRGSKMKRHNKKPNEGNSKATPESIDPLDKTS